MALDVYNLGLCGDSGSFDYDLYSIASTSWVMITKTVALIKFDDDVILT